MEIFPTTLLVEARNEKPLHSYITNVNWEIGTCDIKLDHRVTEQRSFMDFTGSGYVINSNSNVIQTSPFICVKYHGNDSIAWEFIERSVEMPNWGTFLPGRNDFNFKFRFILAKENNKSYPGKYTIWLTDNPHDDTIPRLIPGIYIPRYMNYTSKSLNLHKSSFLNLMQTNRSFLILGLIGIGVFLIGGTVFVMKKRKKSLQKSQHSLPCEIFKETKQLVYSAKFEQALTVLNKLQSQLEKLNDVKLNQTWLRFRNRCNINLSYQKQLKFLINTKLSVDELDKCLLGLWREIHSLKHKEYVDPQIKTDIVLKIREYRKSSLSKYGKNFDASYPLTPNKSN